MNTTLPILDRLTALSDPTRSRILALLEGSEFTVSELCAVLQAPQPTVSRHLKTLAADGWVRARADGRRRHYRIHPDLDDHALALWEAVRSGLDGADVLAADAERAREVLAERRLRSQSFFAGAARDWDALREDLFGSRGDLLPLFALLDPAWTVGDLGTGTGALAAAVAPFVTRVIGVDRSAEMLKAAATRLKGVANAELRTGDLEDLPLEDGELDLAVLSLVLHYVVDPAEALAEAHRALRPGGKVLVVDMRSHDRGPEYAEEMGHVWPGFDPDRMLAWMAAAGFRDSVARPVPPDPEARGPALFLATGRR